MPEPDFTLSPGTNNWMQDFAWDPLKDEIFMTQNIRTSNGRQTIRINRLGPADDQGVRHFISSMTLTDAGHGDVLGLQRKGNALLLWISWSHYSGGTRKTDLVRFQWKAGTYTWSSRPPAFKIMPKFGITQNVQAKLDPTGTYLVYRISGNGRDRYERRKVNEVESGVNHTYGKAGSFPLSKARATAMGWNDRYVMQGCATLGDRLWRYTGNADRTDPAALTEYRWSNGKEVARHNEPKDAGWTGSGIWEPEGMAIVKDGVIKVWHGIVRGDREHLIFRRIEPDKIRLTLTIEQHAQELLDLLDSEDPQEDSAERQVLFGDLLVRIEERQDHWYTDDAE